MRYLSTHLFVYLIASSNTVLHLWRLWETYTRSIISSTKWQPSFLTACFSLRAQNEMVPWLLVTADKKLPQQPLKSLTISL